MHVPLDHVVSAAVLLEKAAEHFCSIGMPRYAEPFMKRAQSFRAAIDGPRRLNFTATKYLKVLKEEFHDTPD